MNKQAILTTEIKNNCIYIINLMLGADANFWFLRDKPQGDTIMNWFPDAPLHITVLIPAAIFAFSA